MLKHLLNKIKSKIQLYFWWIKSYDTNNTILSELSRNAAMTLGMKPFKKIRVVYRNDIINAAVIGFLCRTIVISQGIIDILTLDELKTVFLHEYAHCYEKHHLKLLFVGLALSTSIIMLLYYFLMFIYIQSEIISITLTIILLILLYIALQIFIKYLTRKFEERADNIVIKNFKEPKLYISTLQKIALKNSTKRVNIWEKLFSSHPPINERIHKLYKYIKK
uniref:Peptidase M48 domain-containing protein n=2 Tax=Ignisphaera aggregans TaxID=334771 RepID=A0A7C5YY27_9CREN